MGSTGVEIHTDGDFATRIAGILAQAADARRERAGVLAQTMARREEVEAEFRGLAGRLQRDVVAPRIEALVRSFAGVRVEHFTTPGGVSTRCSFPQTPRFPAATTLDVGMVLAHDAEVASLVRRTDIAPALLAYERFAHHDVPLAELSADAVAPWVEQQLLDFLSLYLRLETDDAYQQASRHEDPVCGMHLSAADAHHAFLYEHHTYLFCSDACEVKFRADPGFYLKDEPRPLGTDAAAVR